MIYWVTTRRHSYTIRRHLEAYGASVKSFIKLVSYKQLLRRSRHPAGVYILSDIERLTSQQAERVALVRANLRSRGNQVLNHPQRSMRRYELLRTLHEKGVNDFNIYRIGETNAKPRFPIFFRRENDHRGTRSGLVLSQAAYDQVLADLSRTRFWFRDEIGKRRVWRWGPWRSRDLVATEFCDTVDSQGLCRKYSAFCIGEQIVPRHLFFGSTWHVKAAELQDEHTLAEEREYVFNNPHEQQLREIFQHAQIEYGRIDYGMHKGRIQVWEINTNPMISARTDQQQTSRLAVQLHFAALFDNACRDLLSANAAAATLTFPTSSTPGDTTRRAA